MTEILTLITWSIVGLVVLFLVLYLSGTLLALYRAGNHLAELNRYLETVGDNTGPFAGHLEGINQALGELHAVLVSINRELKGIVGLFNS